MMAPVEVFRQFQMGQSGYSLTSKYASEKRCLADKERKDAKHQREPVLQDAHVLERQSTNNQFRTAQICKKSFLRMKYKDFLIFFFCLTPFLKLKRAILTLKGSQAYFFMFQSENNHQVWELMFYCEASWDRN